LELSKIGKCSIFSSFFLPIDQKTIGDKILYISSLITINDGLSKILLLLNQKIFGLSLEANQIQIPFCLFIFYFVKFIFN
jgi:hypothetical protein